MALENEGLIGGNTDEFLQDITAEVETIIIVIAEETIRVAMRILEDATDEIQTGGLHNMRTLEKLPQVHFL